MKSEWMVTNNPDMGDTPYGCFRFKDVNGINHSGNRENYGVWYATKAEAEKSADRLNVLLADTSLGGVKA